MTTIDESDVSIVEELIINDPGMNRNDLYTATNYEKVQLSLIINTLKSENRINIRNECYYPVGVDLPPVKPKVVYGTLQKKSDRGLVALYIYTMRDSGIELKPKDIALALPYVKLGNIYSVLEALRKLNYVTAIGENGRYRYVWSKRFAYPYSIEDPGDMVYLKANMPK